MKNPYIITVKRKKEMIDLTDQGRLDWFSLSLQEEEQKRIGFKNTLDREAISEYGPTPIYSIPTWVYPDTTKLSWFEMLSSWEWKKVLALILP